MKVALTSILGFGLLIAVAASPSIAADDPALFIQKAIGINLEEIQLGQLAQERAESEGVRQYGAMPVNDHTANNAKATALANSLGAQVPGAPSAKAQQTYQELSGAAPDQFDEAFVSVMLLGHQTAIDLFTAQVEGGGDEQVAQYASDTLPGLKAHLDEARDLQNDLVGATAPQ